MMDSGVVRTMFSAVDDDECRLCFSRILRLWLAKSGEKYTWLLKYLLLLCLLVLVDDDSDLEGNKVSRITSVPVFRMEILVVEVVLLGVKALQVQIFSNGKFPW
jgi:hypothetical protein